MCLLNKGFSGSGLNICTLKCSVLTAWVPGLNVLYMVAKVQAIFIIMASG